jgi:hypothetical protein
MDFDAAVDMEVGFDIDQWISTWGYAIVVFDSADENIDVFD